MIHQPFRAGLLANAIRFGLIGLMGTSPLALAEAAQARADIRTYEIAAGSLNTVLSRFAGAAGAAISFDSAQLRGRQSAGLHGQYSAEQGFAAILSGTGLQAVRQGNGSYVLLERSGADVLELGATSVTGTSLKGLATTEGTGSYTTGVTSTATKMNLSIRETPQSISVVTRQRMDDQNLTSITKVLEQTPGVTVSRDAGERFNIYSRGNEISKYQFDGLTTHVENATQNMTQNLADMSIYDRIEIVRGATGLMTGAGRPSGVVNMVRKKPTKEFQASLGGSVGRWDDYRGQVDVSGPLMESGKLRARLVGAKQDNDTFTDYYSQKRDTLYSVVEADITSSTTVRFGIDYQKYEADGQTGVPLFYAGGRQTNLPRSTSVGSKSINPEYETTNYFFNLDQALENDWKLTMGGSYMDVDREEKNILAMVSNRNQFIDPATGNYPAERIDKITNPLNQKSAAINLQGPFALFGREHQAIIGYEFSRYKSHYKSYGYASGTMNLSNANQLMSQVIYTPSNDLDIINDYYVIQRGYYAALRLNPIDRIHVILGARTSDYKYESIFDIPPSNYSSKSNYKKSGEVTPYAGLIYDLTPEQSIYISYTDIFTPNNVTDINGKVIEPQVGANYEAGWKGEFYDSRLNANVALYQIKRDNATEVAGYHALNIAYYRAIDGMETKGIDLEIAGEVLPGWNVSGSYSHSRSEDSSGVRKATEHPVDSVKLWNTYGFSGNWQGLTIGGGARWQSKMSMLPITVSNIYYRAVQDDFVVVDAMARYKFNQHLSATLNIDNLLDKKYYTAVGSVGYGYYGTPRNATFSIRYDF
ncbi:TonB-dependent siderophore receptor [Stutzerimonas kirkiae]|uniref:TonB-dependent siderophore receptor n=1 Tax=Stutzerimonas kirkiae TaxID=2211392 RepID=UPI0010383D58|nr:TonB-dependent siderophore receptor [Stutzerimonas kirkiae]TBV05844.1 TonB-dependent siderophore receptor [Stutzerimonas kirkiae]